MTNIVYIATSLDGFIAGKDGDLEWLNSFPNPSKHDYGYAVLMNRIDGIVMGRNTFEMVLSFDCEWPYEKRVFVLSSTLKEIPDKLQEKAEILDGEPHEILSKLSDRGYKNLYVDGGKVVQSFLGHDLVDEMIITTIPILLGGGIPLFGALGKRLDFQHVKTEAFDTGVVQSTYKRTRKHEK